jgi:hypothetical protein
MESRFDLGGTWRRLTTASAPPPPHPVTVDGHRYEVSFVGRELHQHYAGKLLAGGVHLPLSYRPAWREAGLGEGWLIAAQRQNGTVAALLSVDLTPTRALPLHRIARAERVGAAAEPEALMAAITAAATAAIAAQNVLRFEVSTFHRDASLRARLGAHLESLGFSAVSEPEMRVYRNTAAVDLRADEPTLMAGLHKTARRHVRAIDKNPVRLGPIEPRHAAAVEALVRETRSRTGGAYSPRPWARLIGFSHDHPELMHWVGLFHEPSDELVAFASSHHHGDYATYADAGSARRDDLKLPLGYALVWDLICWARSQGAVWFDFGGITDGSYGDGKDPTGGISDFKRYFRGEQIEVASEWLLEPHPARAKLAGVARELALGARSLFNRR